MNGKNPLCIALCVAVSTASFAQTGKKYPDPAPMTHDMSEFWEPQPRIVTPADMDRAVPPPTPSACWDWTPTTRPSGSAAMGNPSHGASRTAL